MTCGFLLQNVLTFSSRLASYLNRVVGHHLLLADGSAISVLSFIVDSNFVLSRFFKSNG